MKNEGECRSEKEGKDPKYGMMCVGKWNDLGVSLHGICIVRKARSKVKFSYFRLSASCIIGLSVM